MISVMIPTFNDEDTLGVCLHSFENFADEVCIVDDASTDSTPGIIFSLHFSYNLVYEQNPSRQGWVANRQRLLAMAGGDILLSTDSDCVLRESCKDDLRRTMGRLSPKQGVPLPTISLAGDVFHTNDRVIEGPDPNHSMWKRGGREWWFTNPLFSQEHLGDVTFGRNPYPGQPPLFHLKSVRSDWRIIQRQYAREWLADGGKEPFDQWLIGQFEIEDLPEWTRRTALRLILSEGIRRYDAQEWYPYPAIMEEELASPRYRLVYEGDEIVGREKLR